MSRSCRSTVFIVVTLGLVVTGLGSDRLRAAEPTDKPIAPLLEGLGALHHPISCQAEKVQTFFDQGLRLAYGFNHAEALRAFQEAARLDPNCAMAYWGQAYALGPNINAPMSEEAAPQAYAAIQKALTLRLGASEAEQAYIDALSKRFSKDNADRKGLDQAYADAMGAVAKRFADDPDAATLYADAIMNTMPWDYWQKDGQPRPGTAEVISTLESVIARHPDHPGAHHFYIHIVEASEDPDRAVPSAERLGGLMPGAGHLVHMPAHIYIRVGRYSQATEANLLAIKADEDYITQCRAQGIYPVAYYPHNIHFLWASLSLEGRSQEAIEAARKLAEKVPPEKLKEAPPFAQIFPAVPYWALSRFGRWDEILAEPEPPAGFPFLTAMWHYARGRAFGAKRQLHEAEQELEKVKQAVGDSALAELVIGASAAPQLVAVAAESLAGELAAKRANFRQAVSHLEEAVRLQDDLPYNEPPDWYYPVRQSLGAVLLEAGRAAEAEAVYRTDLKKNRGNGWSLFGLLASLRAQGKTAEAAEVAEQFEKAWARADIVLTASRF